MSSGRCAGCGFTDSTRRTGQHIMTCPQYLHLYATTPDRCLDPRREYQRHRAYTSTTAGAAARRDDRLRHRFAQLDHRAGLHRARTPADRQVDD